MDIDVQSRTPDPFAGNTFKVRKQRHIRPLKTANDDDNKNSSSSSSSAAVTKSQSPETAATEKPSSPKDNSDGDRIIPDADSEDRGGGGGKEKIDTEDAGRGNKGGDDDEDEELGMSMAEILRRRKQLGKTKKAGGLDFNALKPRPKTPPSAYDEEAAEKDAIDRDVSAVVNRFTHTQGAIVNVDEHMMKFIESELQKRRIQESSGYSMDGLEEDIEEPQQRSFPAPLTSTKLSDRKLGKWPIRPDFRGPAIGKLQEIDLGTEHTKTNIQRTEDARRRMLAGQPIAPPEPDPEEERKKKKNKKKRTDEDLERDRLVEEVLKESRLDIYEDPDPAATKGTQDEEFAADDRIAEQFRREFMEALNARRRGRSNHHKKRDETRKPRGPKLGGSRAARAAMRASEREAAAAAAGGVKR